MSTIHLDPTVTAFVAEVRRHLADLDAETVDELVGGLEADIADQVADGAPLGDPAAYAGELRSAAGLPDVRVARRGSSLRTLMRPDPALDCARNLLDQAVQRAHLGAAWDLLVAARPAWWVLRGWIAAQSLDLVAGPGEAVSLVPSLGRLPGGLVLAAAILGSIAVGTGRVWPGGRRGPARLLLLGLNAFAIFVALGPLNISSFDQFQDPRSSYAPAAVPMAPLSGLMQTNGRPVTNIFAYDQVGRPVPHVQLVDQDGRPLTMDLSAPITTGDAPAADGSGELVPFARYLCPARNGTQELANVFPLSVVRIENSEVDGEYVEGCTAAVAERAKTLPFPLTSLPPVTVPGTPAASATPDTASPTGPTAEPTP